MRYIKKFFLLLLPSIIKKLFKLKDYQYISKFETYKEAKEVSNIYFDKKATEKFFGPKDVKVSVRFNLISLLVLTLNKKRVNILDYGGGANPVYSYIEKSTNIRTNTYVIETKNFCQKILLYQKLIPPETDLRNHNLKN